MDTGAWWATVYGVAKSWTRLSDFYFPVSSVHTFQSHHICLCLDKSRGKSMESHEWKFYGPGLEIVYTAFVQILLATYGVSGKCGLAL